MPSHDATSRNQEPVFVHWPGPISARPAGAAVLLLVLVAAAGGAQAAPIHGFPVEVEQPNGISVPLFVSGTEHYNWYHDADGYTVVLHPKSGWWVYAGKEAGRLYPSDRRVGFDNPRLSKELRPGDLDNAEHRRVRRFDVPPAEKGKGLKTPHAGTMNNLVVFIRFSGEPEFTNPVSTYDDLFNNSAAGASSLYNYFDEVSYSQLQIPSTFYPVPPGSTVVSYPDGYARGYYRPYSASNKIGYKTDTEATTREHTLLVNAVNSVDWASALGGLDVDADDDGYVDNVVFVISGSPDGWSDLLWPHRWVLYSYVVNIQGARVYDYNFQLNDHMLGPTGGVGVLCHEMFHSLGAPDLYHYYTSLDIYPAWKWDIMEYNTNPPQHMLMHMKRRYGEWIPPLPELTVAGSYELQPTVTGADQAYRIPSPNSATEYLVVEYRQKTGTFEGSLPGTGLIVYRVDPAYEGNADGPPDEVYVFRPGGTPTVNGTPDLAHFSSGSGRTEISNTTNPYIFLQDGVTLGGVRISNIGAAGSSITFDVDFYGSCVPSCTGRACGDDGCGGSCGTCPFGWSCTAGGQCAAGSVAGMPFSENFESGSFASHWYQGATGQGRLCNTTILTPRGSRHAILDDTTADSVYSLAELVLAVDLEDWLDVTLSFWHKHFTEEGTAMPPSFSGSGNYDGVALSVDGGTWYRINSLTPGTAWHGTYQQFSYDLSAVAAANGITLGPHSFIKFQWYDNFPADPWNPAGNYADGFAFDDIAITGCLPDCTGKGCGDDGCGGSCGTCSDAHACTDDTCDAGTCQFTPQTGWCLIDGGCIADGTPNPANECQECQAETAPTLWSNSEAGTACGSGSDAECDNPDSCDGSGACQTNNEPEYTGCSQGGEVCRGGLCGFPPDLFFSEYVEGSGSNQALEIYNDDPAGTWLEGCEIEIYPDGSGTAGASLPLGDGTLAAGGIRLVCNSAGSITGCDRYEANLAFSGNDALVLSCGGIPLDIIGQIGHDPGDAWGNLMVTTRDHTLRRRCGTATGDRLGSDSFDPNDEWLAFPSDDFADLGVWNCRTGFIAHYYSGWSQPYIHYDAGSGWTTLPGDAMTYDYPDTGDWWVHNGPAWSGSLAFVFNNGAGGWDNAPGGGNYTTACREFWVKDGAVYCHNPFMSYFRVHYWTGWSQPYIHYDAGFGWTALPGQAMWREYDSWWTHFGTPWGNRVDFAFNDGNIGKAWDNPPGGGNYTTELPEVWIKDGIVHGGNPGPMLVDLLGFSAERTGKGIALAWQTGSELDCGLFRLARCTLGGWRCDRIDRHAELPGISVPCLDSLAGGAYEALDATALPEAGYSYWLREYETTGGIRHYGPVQVEAGQAGGVWARSVIPGGDPSASEPEPEPEPEPGTSSVGCGACRPLWLLALLCAMLAWRRRAARSDPLASPFPPG